jgi:probable O-glycosylation ligase (exosortase A-associated)
MAFVVPKIIAHPYVGALTWVVFGIGSPNMMTWGFARGFQWSMLIAILTLGGLLFTKDHKKSKGGAAGVVLVVFTAWICFTNMLPTFNPEAATAYWINVMKIFLMTGVLMLLLHTRRHVELLVWSIAMSVGFYGIKGGIFTILHGGAFRVQGPDGSAIENNNTLAVGLVIAIPLMMHLYQQYSSKWARRGLASAAILCAFSVLGSWSRGALLAIFAMGCLLWIRSANKLVIFIGALLFTLIAIPMMPDDWTKRMHTVETYEDDDSAQGRLFAWQTATNIAKDKFPIGGGFEWNGPATSAKYSPNPNDVHVAHSIYFQVLGSQGFMGLAIFLLFLVLVWLQCSSIRRRCRGQPDLAWAFSLASMSQVSLVGFFIGGAFLDLAFWDLPYYLAAAIGITQYVVTQELAPRKSGTEAMPALRHQVSSGARSYPAG